MSNNTSTLQRRALSVQETARVVGVSRATVYRWIEQKRLATLKIGARRLVPVTAIDALLAGGAK
jgi:excisionase family DNA binding protein